MSFEFKKPVYIGDTIKCDLALIEIDARGRAKAEAVLTNQHHITMLQAVLFGIIPGLHEKQVLRDMINEGDPTNKLSYEKHQ